MRQLSQLLPTSHGLCQLPHGEHQVPRQEGIAPTRAEAAHQLAVQQEPWHLQQQQQQQVSGVRCLNFRPFCSNLSWDGVRQPCERVDLQRGAHAHQEGRGGGGEESNFHKGPPSHGKCQQCCQLAFFLIGKKVPILAHFACKKFGKFFFKLGFGFFLL